VDLHWQFELTAERIADLTHRYEWALQHQNARFARKMRAWRVRAVTALGTLGCALIVLLYALQPDAIRTQPVLFGGTFAIFIAAMVIVRVTRRGERARQLRYVGSMLARTAARTYRKPGQQVPYTIDYSCDGRHVRARVERLRIDRQFELRKVHLVLHADSVAFVYRFGWSLRPMRFVYLPGAPELTALLAAFDAAGVPHERLAGPAEGYVEPIAQARVSSS
jgi:hypothetical protein